MSLASEMMQPSAISASTNGLLGFRLTFTQGFLAGQLSVVIIALIAIRYIIFEDSRSPSSRVQSSRAKTSSQSDRMRKSGKSVSNKDGLGAGAVNIGSVMTEIMSKVQYEADSHAGESVDWLNVVIAQAIAGYRDDIIAGGWSAEKRSNEAQVTAREWMENILNAKTVGRGMKILDPIQVNDVTFGDAYPIFTNTKVRPADDTGRMRVEVDVDYSDCISLSIDTKLVLNIPRPRFAVLPISLGLAIERFSGTLAIELFSCDQSDTSVPAPHSSTPPRSRHELHLSLHPDFALDATATSLVGSRAKLQDVPKIEQILVDRLRSFIHDRFVWPKFYTLVLPNLVSRGATTDAEVPNKIGTRQKDRSKSAMLGKTSEGLRNDKQDSTTTAFDNGIDDIFFESAPPLFPQRRQQPYLRQPDGNLSLPGSLPSVEAWRSQAATTGGHHHSQSRPDGRPFNGEIRPAVSSEVRQRSSASINSSTAYT
ncbi:hypothetical protein CBS101457_000442 [Exobasidium rhododendri]|nr:hypothetical protein CBS101457_000442 [Exobasidium rhododendri]